MATPSSDSVELGYRVDRSLSRWELEDVIMPEARPHDLKVEDIRGLLRAWARRSGRNVQIGRNIAVRWDVRRPRVGVDPDVYVVEPPPPEGDDVRSLRLWQEGHAPPLLVVEVVSSNSHKDYVEAPDKYAACGAGELWVFDPEMAGPAIQGGPYRLQLWRRDERGRFLRAEAGDGPFFSTAVGAWVGTRDGGSRLCISDDREGLRLWLTIEEEALAAEQQVRGERDEALARVAALEALLASREPGRK